MSSDANRDRPLGLRIAAIAGLLNWQLGTNFGFLARKPVHPSILDYLGPWPYYILVCEGLAPALFGLCYGVARLVEHGTREQHT